MLLAGHYVGVVERQRERFEGHGAVVVEELLAEAEQAGGGRDAANLMQELSGRLDADGKGDFANMLEGVAEEFFGPGEAELFETVVEPHAGCGGKQVGEVGGVHVQGGSHVTKLHGAGIMFVDIIEHPLNNLLAVAQRQGRRLACPGFFGLAGEGGRLPCSEGGFQIVDDEPCQPHRPDEGALAGTGSRRGLLHRERYRMPVKHLDPGAEVAGTTEAAKAFLRPLAAPPLRPAFPQAGVASFRRLGRWALARAGTEYVRRVACCVLRVAWGRQSATGEWRVCLGETTGLRIGYQLVPPGVKTQSRKVREQVQAELGEPLLEKPLTLPEGQNGAGILGANPHCEGAARLLKRARCVWTGALAHQQRMLLSPLSYN